MFLHSPFSIPCSVGTAFADPKRAPLPPSCVPVPSPRAPTQGIMAGGAPVRLSTGHAAVLRTTAESWCALNFDVGAVG